MDQLVLDDLRVSFAQHGEDVVLHRVFGQQREGFWIDVGANDPVVDSVTHAFSLRGWSGINVEPQQALFSRLQAARPRDVNLQVAVSDRAGTLEFHEFPAAHGRATANDALVQQYREAGQALHKRSVPCVTLKALCEQHVGARTIDFLKIDVEGLELEVIRGGDFTKFRPRVLVIECGVALEAWHALVLSLDYVLALDDGLNRFYVRAEERALLEPLRWPANVTDRWIRAEHAELIRGGREWRSFGPVLQSVTRRLAALKDRSPQLKAALKAVLASRG
jgi:FkbM family methyltransferase